MPQPSMPDVAPKVIASAIAAIASPSAPSAIRMASGARAASAARPQVHAMRR